MSGPRFVMAFCATFFAVWHLVRPPDHPVGWTTVAALELFIAAILLILARERAP